MTPEASVGETGGLRWFVGAFPAPTFDKNSRLGVVLNDTSRMKKGQRYMVPEARDYRDLVTNCVLPVILAAGGTSKEGWFRKGRPWGGVLLQYAACDFDFDHWVSGLVDDLVRSGLAKDDAECTGVLPLKLKGRDDGGLHLYLSEGWPG